MPIEPRKPSFMKPKVRKAISAKELLTKLEQRFGRIKVLSTISDIKQKHPEYPDAKVLNEAARMLDLPIKYL